MLHNAVPSSRAILETKSDAEFIDAGVALMKKSILNGIDDRGFSILGLSVGATPLPIYAALGQLEDIDWLSVWIFLVDDRYVPADNPNSNQFLLRSTLLKHAPIPESHLLFPDTSLPLSECIDLYERCMEDLLHKGCPNIVMLGMGYDGHIASLFPPLDSEAFGPSLVIHTTTEKFAVKHRISVTMPVLTQARQSIFFLKGEEKKSAWNEMIGSNEDERHWPAKLVIDGTETTVIAQWQK